MVRGKNCMLDTRHTRRQGRATQTNLRTLRLLSKTCRDERRGCLRLDVSAHRNKRWGLPEAIQRAAAAAT